MSEQYINSQIFGENFLIFALGGKIEILDMRLLLKAKYFLKELSGLFVRPILFQKLF